MSNEGKGKEKNVRKLKEVSIRQARRIKRSNMEGWRKEWG